MARIASSQRGRRSCAVSPRLSLPAQLCSPGAATIAALAAPPCSPRRDLGSRELGPVSADLIPYLTVRNKFDKETRRPEQRHTGPWSEFVTMCTTHTVMRDKGGCGFAPLTMVDAPCRCGGEDCPGKLGHLIGANVLAFTVLMLDVDKYRADLRQLDQTGAERSMVRLRELKLRHIVYSTHSHRYPDHASLRVAIALSRPVSIEEWPLFFPAVTAMLDIEHDPGVSGTVGRFWYLPAHPPGAEPIAYAVDGDPIDVDAIMAVARAAQAAKPPAEPPRPRQPYTPRGDEFDIRAAMATSYPDVREETRHASRSPRSNLLRICRMALVLDILRNNWVASATRAGFRVLRPNVMSRGGFDIATPVWDHRGQHH